jgi:hypothetical protein
MAFWATVLVVVVLVAYPLSFGPAVWLTARANASHAIVESVYWPILWLEHEGPDSSYYIIRWYGSIGTPAGEYVVFELTTSDGESFAVSFGG